MNAKSSLLKFYQDFRWNEIEICEITGDYNGNLRFEIVKL